MRVSRLVRAAAIGAVLFFTSTMPSQAAPEWFHCEVERAGPATKTGVQAIFVKLTHLAETPMFEKKWFKATPRWEREILAVSLAAMGSDNTVVVKADLFSVGPYPDIIGIYLNHE